MFLPRFGKPRPLVIVEDYLRRGFAHFKLVAHFLKTHSESFNHRLFRFFNSLGRLRKCEPAQGQAIMSATSQSGRMTTGQYTAKATFEKGDATIKLLVIKHGNQWQIGGFNIDSPAFVPP